MPAIVPNLQGGIAAALHGVISTNPQATRDFQALADGVPACGAVIDLPTGTIDLQAPIEFDVNRFGGAKRPPRIWLRGCGADENGGTTLSGNFDGPLIVFNRAGVPTSCSVRVSGCRFMNRHARGVGLQVEGAYGLTIRDCWFGPAWRSLLVGSKSISSGLLEAWGNVISGCFFKGDQQLHPDGIGAALRMTSCTLLGTLAEGWADSALQLAGHVYSLGMRAENCNCVVRTGLAPDGSPFSFDGEIVGLNTEACTNLVEATKATTNLVLRSLLPWGTGNTFPGSPPPQIGVDLQPGSGRVTLDHCQVVGGYEVAAVMLSGEGPVEARNSTAQSTASGAHWDLMMDPAKFFASPACNYP